MSPPYFSTTSVQKLSLHSIPENHHRVGDSLPKAMLPRVGEVGIRGGLGPAPEGLSDQIESAPYQQPGVPSITLHCSGVEEQ